MLFLFRFVSLKKHVIPMAVVMFILKKLPDLLLGKILLLVKLKVGFLLFLCIFVFLISFRIELNFIAIVIIILYIVVSKPAPEWESTAVVNGEFKELKLKDYRGKYVVFFFYPLDL